MDFFEWLEHFIEKYSLLILLSLEAILLICALIGIIALIILAPAWKVVAWFGLAGLVIILGVIAYGIYDEVRQIRKL